MASVVLKLIHEGRNMKIQLDTNAMNALFPEGSQTRVDEIIAIELNRPLETVHQSYVDIPRHIKSTRCLWVLFYFLNRCTILLLVSLNV